MNRMLPKQLQRLYAVGGTVELLERVRKLAKHRLKPLAYVLLVVDDQYVIHAYQPPRFSFAHGNLIVTHV
ncbi:hypothetical protein D3C84_1239870 [compost metagenome]